MIRDLKIDEGMEAASALGVKHIKDLLGSDEALPPEKTTPYRAVVARANYLSADRPDLQFASKEVCRWMAAPTQLSLRAVKRLGRYVRGKPRLVYYYPWQSVDYTDVYSDTDWAGCLKTRKSTSGGCVVMGNQACVADLACLWAVADLRNTDTQHSFTPMAMHSTLTDGPGGGHWRSME